MISINTENSFNDFFDDLLCLFPASYILIKNEKKLDLIKKNWLYALYNHKLFKTCDGLNADLLHRCLINLQLLNQQFIPSCGQFIEIYKVELSKHEDDVREEPDEIKWDC